MDIIRIKDAARIREASRLALAGHEALRRGCPWLYERTEADFFPRIEWMAQNGTVYGLARGGALQAFLGWFPLENFRNLGPGAFTPDWCSSVGAAQSPREISRLLSPLARALMDDLRAAGLGAHSIALNASEADLLDEWNALAYGKIVLDAACPTERLLSTLRGARTASDCDAGEGSAYGIRSAAKSDAAALAELDAKLARHIGEAPVLMPDTRGSTAEEWEEWLEDGNTATFLAERTADREPERRKVVGFIKADPPHFDVSYSVHGEKTLAICGLYVESEHRGCGLGERLLSAIAERGAASGKNLVSVDCETHNPEARAFWLSYFTPVSWSLERRY